MSFGRFQPEKYDSKLWDNIRKPLGSMKFEAIYRLSKRIKFYKKEGNDFILFTFL